MNCSPTFRSWSRVTRLLPLALIVALSGTACSPTQPEPGRGPSPLLDGTSTDGAVRLTWNTHWVPLPDGGPDTTVDQPRRVVIFRSEKSATSGYRPFAERPGGILDTLTVSGLVNGQPIYFKATVFGPDNLPSFTSDPIVVIPGVPDVPPLLSIDIGRWSDRSAAAWSPDGREIAFVRADGVRPELRILNLETGVERALDGAPGEYLNDPAWSPGGTEIAYTSTPSLTNWQLDYRIWSNAAATPARRTLTPGRVDSGPAWGATDSVLVFCRGSHEGKNVAELYRVDPRFPDVIHAITADRRLHKRYASVRAADHLIVFQGRERGAAGLYTVPIAGGGAIAPLLTDPWWEESAPAWSPDGRSIAFTSTRSGHPDIWILDFATRRTRQVTTAGSRAMLGRFASWSPDGGRLAVVEQAQDGAWRLQILAVR